MKTTTEMQLVPISKLVPYVNNARTHSPEQITKLRSSLREFGFINPVIIDRDYGVIAGHGRIMAAKEEGIKEVPCVFADHLTEAQKKAYIIADNRMAMDAGWDEELLRVEIESLQGMDFDPLLTGFDEKELAALFDAGIEAKEDDFDVDAELQKPTFSRLGDMWTLGRHRLVCGDSTNPETYTTLMDDIKANLVITDPPYNVNYEGSAGKIKNDNMAGEKFYEFLLAAFKNMESVMAADASIYVFHADTEGLNFRRAFADAGFYLSGCCIWKKQSLVLGRSPYQWQHEPVLYGWKKNGKHQWYTGRKETTIVETSTSDDLEEWSDWAAVPADGRLASPNRAYIRFRVTLTTTDNSRTPKVIDIRLYDIPKAPYEKIGYARPVVLDSNGAWEAVLENAYDIIVTSEINGEDTLSFKIPYRDGKRGYIDSEKKIQIVDDVYKVRTVTDTRDTDGSAVTEVYAEAEFYDLTFSVRKEERTFEAEYPETAMAYALEGTEWSVGTVTVRTQRTWTSTEKNALSILRNIADLHGGDLVFDCPNRLVHLLTVNGKDSGALFAYKKNMKSIQRVVDTRELVTRLYAVGAEGMTFADINGGRPYVEDFTYTDEVRISTLDCSSFTNPYQMKEYTEMRLADYAKPTISYVLNAMDLSVLTGYEHEAWELGDYVRVEDKELGLSVTTRIVRREYNLQEPWNTVLELSTTLKNLGSSASEWDNAADSLEGTSMVSNNDIREMVPFNLLRNSRADDGLAYWVSSGFEADGENGASGTASFKAEGVAGMTKSLSQTVYPANRSSYTLSAQIGSENLEKLSEDSQVGIEVVIEYEDGSTESRFIDLY